MRCSAVKNQIFSSLLAIAVAVLSCAADVRADLIINLDFSNFTTGAPANGSVILGGASLADARAVVETAARYWELVFAGSSSSIGWATNVGGRLTQNLSVGWGSRPGATLATGGTIWSGTDGSWTSGSLTWDNDGSSNFFVDTSPTDSVEWNQFSGRGLNFNGVAVNVERIHFDAPAGVARSNSDMLSVAIHEIAHGLGWLGGVPSFPAYAASDLGGDGDIDITSGSLSGAEIGVSGGHTSFEILTPSTQFPYDPGGGAFFPQTLYGPNVMSPSLFTGTRALLTEADIAITAQFLQFDMNTVNFNPSLSAVPEPSGMSILGIAGLLFSCRRRKEKVRRQ